MTTTTNNIPYFQLRNDGESAIVRILHTSPTTIESAKTHSVMIDGKRKVLKCAMDGCPLCQRGVQTSDRIYIHVWDYTHNCEAVWDRTPKIMSQLNELATSWGRLCDLVVKIIRNGQNFPQYTITIVPPTGYAPVDPALIDAKLAYRFSMYRSKSELEQFVQTGILPPHQKAQAVPKADFVPQNIPNNVPQSVPNCTMPNVNPNMPQPTPYAIPNAPYVPNAPTMPYTPVVTSPTVNTPPTTPYTPYNTPSTPYSTPVTANPSTTQFSDPFMPINAK